MNLQEKNKIFEPIYRRNTQYIKCLKIKSKDECENCLQTNLESKQKCKKYITEYIECIKKL